jgi:hypothetical protein
VQLSYRRESGTETCPDEAALRAAVIARLGRDPFVQGARSAVSVEMTARGQRVKALIRTENLGQQSAGEREVSGDVRECAELVSSAALAIAIAIDPQLLIRPTPDDSANTAAASTQDAEKKPDASPPRPGSGEQQSQRARAQSSTHWYDFTLGAQITWREVPGLGLVTDIRRSTRSFSLGLEGSAGQEKTRELAGGQVDVASLRGTLVACWRREWLGLCGKGGLVGQRLVASGYPDARQGWRVDSTLGLRLEASRLLTRSWGLRSHLDAAFSPRSVELKRSGEVIGRLPRLGVALGAAAFFRFP